MDPRTSPVAFCTSDTEIDVEDPVEIDELDLISIIRAERRAVGWLLGEGRVDDGAAQQWRVTRALAFPEPHIR
jgi:hypothetical protein